MCWAERSSIATSPREERERFLAAFIQAESISHCAIQESSFATRAMYIGHAIDVMLRPNADPTYFGLGLD
jgi:hypothetical protein